MITWKQKFNKKYNHPKGASHSLSEVSKDTGVSKKGLQQIYNKGIGAYKTNPQSVRPNVTSKEQWAMARVYSSVMGGKASKIDSKELNMAKGGNVEEINWSEYYKEGGITKSSMSKEMQDRLFDENGDRKIDRESIRVLTDYVNSLPQTKSMYYNESTDKYSPSRQKVHKEILKEFQDKLVCIESDEPIAILMGGSPASGKSTFLRKYAPYLLSEELLRIDADEVRSQLPEYEGWNASQTHLETKDIVNTLLSDRTIGMPCKFDVIYDGTMNNTKSYLPLIKTLRELGYKIFVVYIDNVPKDVIVKRALERYGKSGRFVPLEVIDDFFDKGKSALNEIKQKVDGYMIVDGGSNDYSIIEESGIKLPQNRAYGKIGFPTKMMGDINRNKFYKEYYERLSPTNFDVKEKGGKIEIVPNDGATDIHDEAEAITGGFLEKGGETNFNPDGKIKDKIVHVSGEAGGMLVGKRHSKGGIKALNKSTGQPLEMEGGEVVITRNAVSDNKKRSFNGKMMTNREILSSINESGGGVSFADGGQVPNDLQFDCNAEYEYGGKTMCGKDLAYALGGQIDLFEDYQSQPKELSEIVEKYEERYSDGDMDYKDTEQFLKEVNAIGYTFDSGLDNSPYDLREMAMGGVTTAIVTNPNEAMADLQSTYGFGDVYEKGGEIKTLNDIKETFAKGNQLAKLELDDELVYWFNIKELSISHTRWGHHSNRLNLYYDSEKTFYDSVKRILAKQKRGSTYAKGGTIYKEARQELGKAYLDNLDKFAEGGGVDDVEENIKVQVAQSKEPSFQETFLKDKISDLRKMYNIKKRYLSEIDKGISLRNIRKYEIALDEIRLKNRSFEDVLNDFAVGQTIQFGDIDAKRTIRKGKSINGEKSELTEKEYDAVRSQGFLNWFGDWELAKETGNNEGVSKIINSKTKEPLVVYHGTDTKFTSWETYAKNNLHYFAKKKRFADFFATSWQVRTDDEGVNSAEIKSDNPIKGTFVYSCFLDIKNPIDFTPFGIDKVPFNDYLKYLEVKYDLDLSKIDGYNEVKNRTEAVYSWIVIRKWQQFNLFIKNNTPYDGFSFYEFIPDSPKRGFQDASLSFTAFNSNQIKFTNNSSFSKFTNDSRLEVGGLIF